MGGAVLHGARDGAAALRHRVLLCRELEGDGLLEAVFAVGVALHGAGTDDEQVLQFVALALQLGEDAGHVGPARSERHVMLAGAERGAFLAVADFDAGEYRWVAQVCAMVCHAGAPGDASVQRAQALGADALEQLGYQAESATWRNSYLLAARELRGTSAASAPKGVAIGPDIVSILPLGSFLEYLGIRVNGPRAQEVSARFDWQLTDASGVDTHRITLSNGALNHLPGSHGAAADKCAEFFIHPCLTSISFRSAKSCRMKSPTMRNI